MTHVTCNQNEANFKYATYITHILVEIATRVDRLSIKSHGHFIKNIIWKFIHKYM